MAHIPDGVLDWPVLVVGGGAAIAGAAVALKRLDEAAIPRTAMMSAAFFTVSLFAVPIGPSSAHLILGGLMGLLIGQLAWLAALVALALQFVLFGFGGLTSLGVNTLAVALPGVAAAAALRPLILRAEPARAALLGALCGGVAALGAGCLVALALTLSDPAFAPAAPALFIGFAPLVIGEAAIAGFAVGFLKRVRPSLLAGAAAP